MSYLVFSSIDLNMLYKAGKYFKDRETEEQRDVVCSRSHSESVAETGLLLTPYPALSQDHTGSLYTKEVHSANNYKEKP